MINLLLPPDLDFLVQLTEAVLEASRIRPGEAVGGSAVNTTGGTLIRPGGRDCYPAFWIRDFAMSLDCGLIPEEEAQHGLKLIADTQAPEKRTSASGITIPQGAIADHILFDGTPIYFPGTYDPEELNPLWGRQPPFDNAFWFIHGVFCQGSGAMDLTESLRLAFASVPAEPDTGLVFCEEGDRGVSFGFTDSVIHTGRLLFASLLRFQAAQEMAQLTRDPAYQEISNRIRLHLADTFMDPCGLLRAATGRSAQPDVWGSAFAVMIGAVNDKTADRIGKALLAGVQSGTLAWQGQIRHLRTVDDFSSDTAWELKSMDSPLNTYQNGAYWATSTGWVCQALAQQDEAAARQLAGEYLQTLRDSDFRKGDSHGGPWECVHPNGHQQNPVYLTSVTCPLSMFQTLMREKDMSGPCPQERNGSQEAYKELPASPSSLRASCPASWRASSSDSAGESK